MLPQAGKEFLVRIRFFWRPLFQGRWLLLTNTVSSGGMLGLGDILQQSWEKHKDPSRVRDWKRTGIHILLPECATASFEIDMAPKTKVNIVLLCLELGLIQLVSKVSWFSQLVCKVVEIFDSDNQNNQEYPLMCNQVFQFEFLMQFVPSLRCCKLKLKSLNLSAKFNIFTTRCCVKGPRSSGTLPRSI